MKKLLKISVVIGILLFISTVFFYYLINQPAFQNWLVGQITETLSDKLKAKVHVGHVQVHFFNKLELRDIYVEDQQGDTLVHAQKLYASVRRFQPLQKKIYLDNIELLTPTVNIYRMPGRKAYNYQFIIDSLTTPSTETPPPFGQAFDINFREVRLTLLKLSLTDSVSQQSLHITLNDLSVAARKIDLLQRTVGLKSMAFDGLDIRIHDFSPLKTSTTDTSTNQPTAQQLQAAFNPDCWMISADDLAITNATFKYDKDSRKPDNRGMDYNHLHITDINLRLRGVYVLEDTVYTRIDQLSAKEKCGFEVLNLTADANLSPIKMEFDNLHVVTPNSDITHYYRMEFDRLGDFGQYETKVKMTGVFDKAKVSLQDIDYFAKAFPSVTHNTVLLSGDVRGPVSNLRGRDLEIEFGKLSKFQGNVTMLGLPNINETFISMDVNRMRTTFGEVRYVIPIMKIPNTFDVLGMMNFSGNFDGFVNDFVANGHLRTSIGELSSDINLKINPDGKAKYSGNFSTYRFDLGAWLGDKQLLGTITSTAKINGVGLQLKTLDASAEGLISSVTVKGYQYNDITVDGDFSERRFNGDVAIRDTNLVMDFSGQINLEDSLPVFNFVADIDTANLMALNLVDEPIGLHSNMKLNFTGNKLDNINGLLDISNTRITRADSSYAFDSLFFQSYDNIDGKVITLRSDIANGWMQGKFAFGSLALALKDFLSYYFINGYQTPEPETIPDQDFVFHVKLENTNNLTTLLTPHLKNVNGGYVNGFFSSIDNSFSVTGEVGVITYDNIRLEDIYINSGTAQGKVNLTTRVDSIFFMDSLITNKLAVSAAILKDSVDFLVTLEDSSHDNHLHIAGALESDLRTLSLRLKDSYLKLKGDRWDISNNNFVGYDGKLLEVYDLKLSNREHFIDVQTQNVNDHTNLAMTFNDIGLASFVPRLQEITRHRIDGRLNGSVNIINLLEEPALVSNIKLDSFTIDNDLLGDLQASGSYLKNSEFVQTRILLEGANRAMIAGKYYIKPDALQQLDFLASIEQFDVAFIEKFVNKYVSKLTGDATGQVAITGSLMEPTFNGTLDVTNGQARVNYLNTIYRFDKNTFTLDEEGIDIGRLVIKDARSNLAYATGQLKHNHLRDFELAFDIETENFQFLNTNESSVEGYYGEIYAGGYVYIMGPLSMVEFYAAATTKPDTRFFVSVNSSNDVDQYSFYQFIDKDTLKLTADRFKVKNTGVRLNFDIAVTPDAEANLILSEQEGDMITGRGTGNLVFEMDEFSDITMVGNYEIADGAYTFAMQNIISKEFELLRGSQILWTGDPYDARLAMKAVYKLRAAPYDLIEDVLKEDRPLQQSKNRVPVFLYLKLNGSLINPDISFDIEVPETDPGIRNALDAKLALVRLDQNELNKQVVGLLVLNRFLPVYPLGSSPNSNIVQGLNNTVSEFVSNQLSVYLSDWISRFVTEVQLNIRYRDYQNQLDGDNGSAAGGADSEEEFQRRRELQLALTKSFFNDRIEVDIGGNFDFGESTNAVADPDDPNSRNTANNIAGDFEIRYNITADGRIKVKVFRKGEYDIFQERNRNKTGVGIAYRREFDTLKDLAEQYKTKRKNRRERRKERKLTKTKAAALAEDEE